MEIVNDERTLTELDHVRLGKLIAELDAGDASRIADLLAGADLVPSRKVSPYVVTMHSQVLLVDQATRRRQTLTVCYPGDAEPAAGFVSVLSPVGASLLGLRVGDVARWRSPSGDERAAEIAAMLFQPEESGDYTT